jgi:hypothetical protein
VPQARIALRGQDSQLTPQDVQEQLLDLERFLEEELGRVSTAMRFAVVQAAYGSMTVDPGPAPDQPLADGVPSAVEGFNNFTPSVPNRVTAQLTPDSLIPEEGGIYQVMATLAVIISSGTEYSLTAFINGTPTGVFARVDTSNQTTSISLILYGMIALNPGDIVTLVAVATGPGGPHTFIIESAVFSLTRISEENDEPGIF